MTRGRRWLRGAAIALCIGASYWLIRTTISSVAGVEWHRLDLAFIALGFVTAAAQECVGTMVATTSLAAFGQRAPFGHMLIVTTTSTATNSLIPVPVGIPARVWLQRKWLNIPVASSTAGIVLETLAGYGSLGVFAVLGIVLFGASIVGLGWRYAPVVVGLVLILAGTAWLLRKQLGARLMQLARFRPAPRPAGAAIALSFVVIIFATLRLWLILRATDNESATVLELACALAIARFAGVASMIPMGLGSRDITLTGLLVLAHIPLPVAILAAAIDRVLSTIPYVAIALAGLPLLRHLGPVSARTDPTERR